MARERVFPREDSPIQESRVCGLFWELNGIIDGGSIPSMSMVSAVAGEREEGPPVVYDAAGVVLDDMPVRMPTETWRCYVMSW